jgi:hypothetical protein
MVYRENGINFATVMVLNMDNLNINKILRGAVLAAAALCGVGNAGAQWWLNDSKWEVSMAGGLNTDGWLYNIGAAYFPIPNLGFKMALGVDGEIRELGDWYWGDDYTGPFYYTDDDDYCTRFQFLASVELRTPPIIKLGEVSCLQLFASPGVILSPGASGSCDSGWAYWDAKVGVMATFDHITAQLGYGYSNFNLYDGNPYSHNGYDYNEHHYTHSGFICVGYRF